MKEVYITGHRNPDLDSVCSAYAYAELKNQTNPDCVYKGVRCGHLSDNVKDQLKSVGLEAVPYMRNVYPKVGDVMMHGDVTIQKTEPVYKLIKAYSEDQPSAIPVFDGDKFFGLLSINDITGWFLKENADGYPLYNFIEKNIVSVLPGRLIKSGASEFTSTIIAGAGSAEGFEAFVSKDANCVVVVGQRKEIVQCAIEHQVPAIIITTVEDMDGIDFSSFKGCVYVTKLGTAETIKRLRMAVPVSDLIGSQGPKLQIDTTFDEGKQILSESHLRGLSVFDGDNWVGYVTRRCFLTKPSYNVILVDHNEVGQSIRGIETANVLEIIDHHRLDALKTDAPIYIDAEPVGSTCTIVYQQFVKKNVVPSATVAKVLLVGIIADTLILKSPTTTLVDEQSVYALAKLCNVSDIQSFGQKLFSGSKALASVDPEKMINSDFKKYNEGSVKLGIGQCEVTTLKDLDDYAATYAKALEQVRKASGLDWAMLMVTDVLRDRSVLITTDNKHISKLPYSKISDNVYDMPGVMSRKKQLLPEVLHTIE